MRNKVYDVIVIGAGHAGCEAALAASRMGCKTLLLTINLDTIAWMSCNSSIGGPGRGQIVREIDALGGEMAQIADKATIHSRRSNTSKGPAVQAPFAIVDRRKYLLAMKYLLERTENLEVRQALIKAIEKNGKRFNVFSVFEEKFVGKTVVLSAGTFMQGEVVYGKIKEPAGRYSEVSAPEISNCLKSLGFRLGRFKTGTSPRISAEGIQLSEMEAQHPDDPAEPLSFWTKDFNPKGLLCYKTRTTGKTLRIISNHVKDIPLLAGEVLVAGARYCPSIEERVLKNPDRPNHPVFLQPQGVDNRELYIQGLSTSLPVDVQEELVRSVKGLENAVIMRPGYAVMYDFIYPDQLYATLETKLVSGLFTAGQINGTSGYEEAAAQGLIAGINAALKAKEKEPFILDRSQAYIGVLIDDLVTKGVDEPYRMFTSRAEYRLILRSDNADLRLTEYGYKLGLIDRERYLKVKEKQNYIERMVGRLSDKKGVAIEHNVLDGHIAREIEASLLYKGYINQELKRIGKYRELEKIRLPEDLDYMSLRALSREAAEKLNRIKPSSVGQAMRIPGLRQTDIEALHIYAKKFHVKPKTGASSSER